MFQPLSLQRVATEPEIYGDTSTDAERNFGSKPHHLFPGRISRAYLTSTSQDHTQPKPVQHSTSPHLTMPTFSSKPLNAQPSAIKTYIRRRPFLVFGLPFLSIVVISSFALEGFTRTRYDLRDQQVQTITKEEELGMKQGRKRVDIKEEYYRLNAIPSSDSALDASSPSSPSGSIPGAPPRRAKFSMAPKSQDELENVRVPRPAGMPEWGPAVVTEGDAPKKGERKTDRWV